MTKTRGGEQLWEIKHDVNQPREMHCCDTVSRIAGQNSYTDTQNDLGIMPLKMQTISSVT